MKHHPTGIEIKCTQERSQALNRFLGEGDVMTGASFTIDGARRSEFLRALKGLTDPEEKRQAITDTFYRDVFAQQGGA